jgi:hypothetical protein
LWTQTLPGALHRHHRPRRSLVDLAAKYDSRNLPDDPNTRRYSALSYFGLVRRRWSASIWRNCNRAQKMACTCGVDCPDKADNPARYWARRWRTGKSRARQNNVIVRRRLPASVIGRAAIAALAKTAKAFSGCRRADG